MKTGQVPPVGLYFILNSIDDQKTSTGLESDSASSLNIFRIFSEFFQNFKIIKTDQVPPVGLYHFLKKSIKKSVSQKKQNRTTTKSEEKSWDHL